MDITKAMEPPLDPSGCFVGLVIRGFDPFLFKVCWEVIFNEVLNIK